MEIVKGHRNVITELNWVKETGHLKCITNDDEFGYDKYELRVGDQVVTLTASGHYGCGASLEIGEIENVR